jgi:hypothetical protein
LIDIENVIGIRSTSNFKLKKYGKLIIGNQFRGVFSADSNFHLRNGEMCIINTDDSKHNGTHWLSLIKFHDKIYCYDSFNRNYRKLSPYFANKKWIVANSFIDEAYPEANCGQRALAWLILANTYSPKIIMEII